MAASSPITIPGEWQCTAEEYHAAHEFQSRSMLEDFRECRPRYYGRYIARTIPPKSADKKMLTGTLSHLLILEPDRLRTDVLVIPAGVLAKNGAKLGNAWKEFEEAHAEKLLVKQDEYDTARAIVDSVYRNEHVRKFRLLEGGKPEHTIVWEDPETGLRCRCRADYWRPGLMVDVKTTGDTRPEVFTRIAANKGYYFQDAFYRMGGAAVYREAPHFAFLVVSNEPPYQVAIHSLDSEFLRVGQEQVRKTLNAVSDCIDTGDWRDDHEKQINEIVCPAYLANYQRWEIQREHSNSSAQ